MSLKQLTLNPNGKADPNKTSFAISNSAQKSLIHKDPLRDNEEIQEASSIRELTKEERKARKIANLQKRLMYSFLGVDQSDERDANGNQITYTGSYHDEKEYVHGDYIIVFPNPDHPIYKTKLNYTFNFQETLQLLNKFFLVNPQKDQTYSDCFDRALALAFSQLKDSEIIGKKPHLIERLNDKAGSKKEKPSNGEIYEDINMKFFDEKMNIGGGFLRQTAPPPSPSDNRFSLNLKKKQGPWLRTKEVTKDLCTLMRHVFMVKLAKEYGFKMRSFISDDGSKIYMVLHAEQNNLHLIAEESSIDKEIELAISDLMSLEPLDHSYRPLRLHSFLHKEDYLEKNKMKTVENEKLRNEIKALLKEIDYKKLTRKVNCKLFLDEKENANIRNEIQVPMHTWKHYLEYLKIVAKSVEEWRNKLGKPINKEEEEKITVAEKEMAFYEALKLKRGPQNKYFEIDPEKMRNESTLLFRSRKEQMRDKTNVQIVKRIRTEKLAQKYKHIFLDALRIIQKKYGKNSLRNLWNYAGVQRPLDAFSDFYNSTSKTSLKKKNRLVALWKKYQLNELGLMGVFLNMEKLKLIQRMFDSMFNLSMIKENGFILDYFFLNDPYALNGLSNAKYFVKFRNAYVETINKTLGASKVENEKPENHAGYSTIKPLEKEWIGFFYVPLRTIRDYYGEKIALFFHFLNYYIYCSFFMIIFSIPMFFLQRYFIDSDFFETYPTGSDDEKGQYALKIATLIFCLVIALWSCLVSELWEGKESIFAVKYGQTEFELEELELSSFEGNFHRSFYNDNMNEEYTGPWRRYILLTIALITAILFFIGNVGVTVGMSFLASKLNGINNDQFLFVGIFISALINTAYVLVTGFIYEKLCVLFTDFENHRTASDYELSFTVKVLLFKTINRLIPLVMIAFINDYFSWGCGDWHCWDYLLVYYRSMLYVFFALQCFQYGWAGWMFLLKKASYKLFEFQKGDKTSTYRKINKYIFQESIKLNFSPSEELDGTLNEFINMSINFAMNALFGVCFPVCFPMSAAIFFISLHFLKFKLIKLCKRPKPVGSATIGACKTVFHLIGYLSVLSNAGLICYTSNILDGQHAVSYFVIIVLGIFILKFMVQRFVVKVPEKMDLILKRGSMVAEKCVKSSKKSGKKRNYIWQEMEPIFKIYGSLLESRPKKKEENAFEEKTPELALKEQMSPDQVKVDIKDEKKMEQNGKIKEEEKNRKK